METNLNELSKQVYEANKKKGFYQQYEDIKGVVSGVNQSLVPFVEQMFFAQRLALITSETSETLEANRKNKVLDTSIVDESWKRTLYELDDTQYISSFEYGIKDTQEDEIADQFIRLLDLCGHLDIDIDFHIKAKLRYNSTRPFKHGKKY